MREIRIHEGAPPAHEGVDEVEALRQLVVDMIGPVQAWAATYSRGCLGGVGVHHVHLDLLSRADAVRQAMDAAHG